eukprot:162555-Ditylum_brightwellii.AAC.1
MFDYENEVEEGQEENESMIEERCEGTDVLILKPDAMKMRRMCVLSTFELRGHLKSLGLDELTATK